MASAIYESTTNSNQIEGKIPNENGDDIDSDGNGDGNDSNDDNNEVLHLDISEVACHAPEDVLHNLNFFSGARSKAEYIDDWLDSEIIDKFNSSRIVKRIEFVPLIKLVATEAYHYNDAADRAVENATDILKSMNNLITADLQIISLVQVQFTDLNVAEKLSKTCEIVNDVKRFTNEFINGADTCVRKFKNKVAPLVSEKIIKDIERLTSNYNTPDADFKLAQKEFEDLAELLKQETSATAQRTVDEIGVLEICTTEKATVLQSKLNEVLDGLKKIIGSN